MSYLFTLLLFQFFKMIASQNNAFLPIFCCMYFMKFATRLIFCILNLFNFHSDTYQGNDNKFNYGFVTKYKE